MKIDELDDIPGIKTLSEPIKLATGPGTSNAPGNIEVPYYGNILKKPSFKGAGINALALKAKGGAEIVKIGYSSTLGPLDDPYIQYVKFCSNRQGKINIPKIYSIKMFKKNVNAKNVNYFYYINLEPLMEYRKLNWEQKASLILRTTGIEVDLPPAEKMLDPYCGESIKIDTIMEAIQKNIKNILYSAGSSIFSSLDDVSITDKELLSTLHELSNFYVEIRQDFINRNKPIPRYDLHAGNFMIRLNPYGPQLVITDPFI